MITRINLLNDKKQNAQKDQSKDLVYEKPFGY